MYQLPTIKDLTVFLKNSWKTIVLSMVAFLLLYASALWYTQRTNPDVIEPDAPLGASVLQGLTQEEYEMLKEDEVSFSFYVENSDDTAFMNYNMLKNYLLSPDIWATIVQGLDLSYEVADYYVLNISRDQTQALHINIGTGDYSENMLLANRLYDMIDNQEIDFFSDKNIYLLTRPKRVLLQEQGTNQESSEVQPDRVNYVLVAVVGVLIAFFFGIVVAIVLSFFKKEFTLTSLAHFNGVDDVVNLTHLKGIEEVDEHLLYSIVSPGNSGRKILLTQSNLDHLKDKLTTHNITMIQSLLDYPAESQIDRIVIVIEKDVTEKKWYNNQRLLLENHDASVKVILL